MMIPEGATPPYHAVPVMLSAGERRLKETRPRGQDRLSGLAAGADRAGCCPWPGQRPDRGGPARQRRHGPKWRGRFAARGLDGQADLPRSGRPRRISALERAAVVALACQLPAATGVPLARRSGPELAAEITKAGLASPISPSSVLRIRPSTPSSPGNTNRGSTRATRTSPPRPPSSSTSTRGTTRASGYGRATGSSRWTPSPPSRPAAGAARPARQHAACHARRARIPAPGRPRPAGRPGRTHREGVRLYPGHYRDHPVHGPDRPGHEHRTLRQRPPGVRDRGQRLRPPRPRPPSGGWPKPTRTPS